MSTASSENPYSWVIAVACCFINCLLYGVSRLSGLLLVATVNTFHVSRAKAALPYTISTSVRNLSGIFVGYLGRKFGLRAVISAGCILASVGGALCFFNADIVWITVCWGGLFGIGCGLGTCLLPLAINQHFNENRGTASGISYSGSYIGSFVFPPLVVLLLDHYGLPGTFLVISGTMLNGLAAAMFFHPPASCNNGNKTNEHKTVKKTSSSLSQSLTATGGRFKLLVHKLLNHIKLPKPILKTKELAAENVRPFIYLIEVDKDQNKYPVLSREEDYILSHTGNSEKGIFAGVTGDVQKCLLNLDSKLASSQWALLESEKEVTKDTTCRLRRYILSNFSPTDHAFKQESLSQSSINLTFFKPLDSIFPMSNADAQNQQNSEQKNPNNKYYSLKFKREVSILSKIDQEETTNTKCIANFLTENAANAVVEILVDPAYFETNSNIPVAKRENFENTKKYTANDNSEDITFTHNQCKFPHLPHRNIFNIGIDNKSSLCLSEKESSSKSRYIQSSLLRNMGRYMFGWLRQFYDPMFCVITVTMSLHTFVVVCMVTIIEDFARDIHVPDENAHHVIMVLSSADLVGSLSLGVITDRGIMSKNYFVALCFFGTGVTAIAISFSNNLISLLVLVAFYGIFETGVIITFPLLIAEFIKVKKQPVALASSNVLSSPTVLLVPLLIGYFRDNIGCYSGVFYVLGATSFGSCLIWLLAPYIIGRCKGKYTSQA